MQILYSQKKYVWVANFSKNNIYIRNVVAKSGTRAFFFAIYFYRCFKNAEEKKFDLEIVARDIDKSSFGRQSFLMSCLRKNGFQLLLLFNRKMNSCVTINILNILKHVA